LPIKKGTELEIVDHFAYEGKPDTANDDHYFVQLASPIEGHQGVRWFIYSLHAQIEGVEINNDPKDEPAPKDEPTHPSDTGPKISLPGISRQVGIYEPVYWGSNFTWAEQWAKVYTDFWDAYRSR
jgi:hypothetical protein